LQGRQPAPIQTPNGCLPRPPPDVYVGRSATRRSGRRRAALASPTQFGGRSFCPTNGVEVGSWFSRKNMRMMEHLALSCIKGDAFFFSVIAARVLSAFPLVRRPVVKPRARHSQHQGILKRFRREYALRARAGAASAGRSPRKPEFQSARPVHRPVAHCARSAPTANFRPQQQYRVPLIPRAPPTPVGSQCRRCPGRYR
jgi:hypothetical protein